MQLCGTYIQDCAITHIYISIGSSCNEFIPTINGSKISNCTSGKIGQGYDGDTCVLTYNNSGYQVNELWSCQDNSNWMLIFGNQRNIHVYIGSFVS